MQIVKRTGGHDVGDLTEFEERTAHAIVDLARRM